MSEVRTLYPSEWGVPYPVGLAYLREREQLALFSNAETPAMAAGGASIVTITPYEDLVGSATLAFAVDNAINFAFDSAAGNLLFLQDAPPALAQVPIGEDGIPAIDRMSHVDISHLDLAHVDGMDVDAEGRRLLLLDSQERAVVIADLDNELTLVSRLALAHLPSGELRGLALHPTTHTLFVASPGEQLLFEIHLSGLHLRQYDLAPLELIDVRGLTFGLSADLTDAPDTIHLFLADSNRPGMGPAASDAVFGRIVEAELRPGGNSPAPETSLHSSIRADDSPFHFAAIGHFDRAAGMFDWNSDFILTTFLITTGTTISPNLGLGSEE